MADYKKEIALIGAGKIGRGFLGDIFYAGGFDLTFITRSERTVDQLNRQGSYTLFKAHEDGRVEKIRIDRVRAYAMKRDEEAAIEILSNVNYASLHIFEEAMEPVAHLLAKAVLRRMKKGSGEPLDVLICVNFLQPAEKLASYMREILTTPEQRAYMGKHVGLVETLVSRTCAEPTPQMLAEDPMAAFCGHDKYLSVDKDGFAGAIPEGVALKLRDRLGARLVHKIWQVNMIHFLMAVYAHYCGYTFIREAKNIPLIDACVFAAGAESTFAISKEFTIPIPEIEADYNHDVELRKDYYNPSIDDPISRVAGNLKRKIGKGDRVVGPALACLKHGKTPYFLAHGLAAAYLYENPEDADACEVHAYTRENGLRASLIKYSGLSEEAEPEKRLMEFVVLYYEQMQNGQMIAPQTIHGK